MSKSLELSVFIPAIPKKIYEAWLSAKKHTAMTGAGAEIDPKVGGMFTAWDGYIEGKNIELVPNKKIVQAWRTSEFPARSKDSQVEIFFEKEKTGTRVTLIHTNIPKGQEEGYRVGWEDYYFKPMKKYFAKKEKNF